MMKLMTLATLLFPVVPPPAGYTETILASGLDRPVALCFLPDGGLLIGEQYVGNIRLYRGGGLSGYAAVSPIDAGNVEGGLRGLACDANGFVYVLVSQAPGLQRVIRYATTGDVGTSPVVLIDNLPAGDRHNGGGIGIGPDGMLYVSIGDTGTDALADDLTSLEGKILRFNPDGTPVAGNGVWCRGLRNVFRFAWDPSTGRMYATENGLFGDDEVNRLRAGAHFGWPFDVGPNADPAYTDPVHTYPTTVAPAGICVWQGDVFVAEWSANRIRRMTLDAAGDTVISGPADFVTAITQPVEVIAGPDGALYYSCLTGEIRRVEPAGAGNQAPTASFTVSPPNGPPPLAVSVDGAASSDLDGVIVSTAWSWGDATPDAAGVTAVHSYPTSGVYEITLTVTDDQGATGTATRSVIVSPPGNQPPSAHIESSIPLSGPAPLNVQFTGHGHDDAGPLQLAWDFGDGSAPVVETGVAVDENRVQTHAYSAAGSYVCTLTVTDPAGVSFTHGVTVTVSAGVPPAPPSSGGGSKRSCGLLGLEVLLVLALAGRRVRYPRAD